MKQVNRKLLTFKVTNIRNYHFSLSRKKLMVLDVGTDKKTGPLL